jgi:NAD-dependent SIR2 family protein deacetylase
VIKTGPNLETLLNRELFETNPEAVFKVARMMLPKVPSLCHFFLALLEEKGVLRRVYTENVDGLELDALVPQEKVMPVHGTIASGRCPSTKPGCDNFSGDEWIKKVSRQHFLLGVQFSNPMILL